MTEPDENGFTYTTHRVSFIRYVPKKPRWWPLAKQPRWLIRWQLRDAVKVKLNISYSGPSLMTPQTDEDRAGALRIEKPATSDD